jgi:type 1 fimbriae regulatory protein FimB
MSRQNFNALLKTLGEEAAIEVPVKPHALRHACGFKLANQGSRYSVGRVLSFLC